jgi:tRNA nucleotidyltransferase/poly(A) polymerase
MHDPWNAVSTNRVLERIIPLLPPSSYLVGGCVRDLLLGREILDVDLVTFSDVWGLAKQMESLLGGKAFWLDRERGGVRIVVKGTDLMVDVLPPRGSDIATDLSMRDITINAMAFDVKTHELLDPLRGQEDLRRGIIRIIAEQNLTDDPLRGIRCLRFAVSLEFAVEEETMSLIRTHAGLIHRVSPERIKQEIMKSLSSSSGSVFFKLLMEAGYGEELFHHGPATDRGDSAGRVGAVEILLEDVRNILPGIGEHFSRDVEYGFSRAAALKLAAFLIGISDNSYRTRDICRKLAFSSRTARLLANTREAQERLVSLLANQDVGRKDLFALFRSYPECIPETLLLAGASGNLLKDRILEIWSLYQEVYHPQKNNPLLSGRDIMNALRLDQGRLVGKYLEMVEDARLEGLISTREEAVKYLKDISSRYLL